MNLDTIGAVFELVLLPFDVPGKLPLSWAMTISAIEVMGQRPPTTNPCDSMGDDFVDGRIPIVGDEFVNRPLEPPRILYQRRDVAELNAGLGKIGDRPYQRLELVRLNASSESVWNRSIGQGVLALEPGFKHDRSVVCMPRLIVFFDSR